MDEIVTHEHAPSRLVVGTRGVVRELQSVLYVNVAATRSTLPVVSAGSQAAELTQVQLTRFDL